MSLRRLIQTKQYFFNNVDVFTDDSIGSLSKDLLQLLYSSGVITGGNQRAKWL